MASRSGGLAARPAELKRRLTDELAKADNAALIPFLRAFSIGYASDTLPAVIKTLLALVLRRPKSAATRPATGRLLATLREIVRILIVGFHPQGSGISCGVAMGGARLLEQPMRPVAERIVRQTRAIRRGFRRWRGTEARHGRKDDDAPELTEREVRAVDSWATLLATSCSSLAAISLLQSGSRKPAKPSPPAPTATPYPSFSPERLKEGLGEAATAANANDPAIMRRTRRQSPTLDLTLFFLVRALDTVTRAAHAKYAPKRLKWLSGWGDVILFQLSCWRIMFCWFYRPGRLPPSYVRWISALAAMDHRLLQLLRFAREGTFVYGEPATDEAMRNIEGIASRLGVSASEVDPYCIPKIPCYVAHGKEINSASCQVNLLRRWFKAFGQSLGIYLPVFLVPALLFRRRKLVRDPAGEVARILQGAGRSSAFLATFVGLTWYGVCLGRTVLFPRLLPSVSSNFWESGFQCQLGSFLCGFSLLLESKRRRGEMALYVAPRALYALMDEVLPQSWLDEDHAWFSTWSERLLFSSSMGVLTSATVHRPDLIRGVAKGIMQYSVGPEWRAHDKKTA